MPIHKSIGRILLQAGFTLCLFLLPIAAAAQGMTFPTGMQESIASITVYIISAMNLLTWVFFIYLTILLDPEFIFNTQNGDGFETVLNSIWILSRDLMNIGFALALIGAAIYTIITAKKDFVASHLKTFVMAVILVNFSWFVPRIIIDVGNVAAAAIYGVPTLLANQGIAEECRFTTSTDMRPNVSCNVIEPAGPIDPENPPPTRYDCQCALLANAKFFLKEEDAQDLKGAGWECVLGPTMCLHFVNLDPNAVSGHSAILNGLIVNHARLQGLAGVPPVQGGSEVGAMVTFLLQQLMVLVIHAALFFPLAAMVVAFAIRVPILWITVAFMPFALLKFVVPSQFTGDYPQKLWDWFLKAAFLPAMVAVPLAVGFILVNAGSQMFNAAPIVSRINVVEFPIADGVSNLFELLWLGLTLGVLYTGVFSVLSKVEFAAPAANFINSIGKSVGGVALKLPLSLPVIPGPGGGRSPLQLLKSIDPRAINYKLSHDPRGLSGVLNDINTGRPSVPFGGATAAASQFANRQRTQQLAELIKKLGALNQSASPGKALGTEQIERFGRELREQLKINLTIDKNKPAVALREFASELGKQPGVDSGTIAELNTHIGKLSTIMANQQPKP